MIGLLNKKLKINIFSERDEIEKYALFGKVSYELFHDLLNPITSLSLYLELINNKNSLDNNITYDEGVAQNLKELNSSSKSIRDFIKLMQDSIFETKNIERIDIQMEINQIIKLNYYKAKRNNVSIVFIQKGKINVDISKIKFYQLIINLISNGIDAFEKIESNRKRKLVIKASDLGDNLKFEFIDNGSGIREKDLKKIFKKNISKKENGFGIGLKTVQKIIRELNGSIKVTSQFNKGTTFEISIPKCTDKFKSH